jgi:hypothetical protein
MGRHLSGLPPPKAKPDQAYDTSTPGRAAKAKEGVVGMLVIVV